MGGNRVATGAQHVGQDPHLHRLQMLCDGVFAISLTLLTLDLKPPAGWDGHALLAAMAPKLRAYAMSFLLIALFWAGHRRGFQSMVRANFALDVLTLIFLGFIALLPPATALLYEYHGQETLDVYFQLIAVTGVVQALGWAYAAFPGRLVAPEVPFVARVFVTLTTGLMPGAMCALSIYSTTGNPWGWAVIGLIVAAVAIGGRVLVKAPLPAPRPLRSRSAVKPRR
jgi:uncharacterized membrane protein